VGTFERNLRIVGSARIRKTTYTGPMTTFPIPHRGDELFKQLAQAVLPQNNEDNARFLEEKPKELGLDGAAAAETAPEPADLPVQGKDEAKGRTTSPEAPASPTSPGSPTSHTSGAEAPPAAPTEPPPPPQPPEGFVHGSQLFEDGTQYTGEWVGGWRHGRGWCKWEDGREFSGQWIQGQPNGPGKFTFPDGSWYQGEVVNGTRQVCVCTYTHRQTLTHTHAEIHVCMYVYTYVHTYIHVTS
jgi:hypothetical protein